ncbi:permease [Anopheles sinensis]|uniref:Permease n=1 Tax=Anopheles sinensis TaxID=74873 RepID=A0A084VHF7_ANOSI|nr:permease [Anopheles sinensis]
MYVFGGGCMGRELRPAPARSTAPLRWYHINLVRELKSRGNGGEGFALTFAGRVFGGWLLFAVPGQAAPGRHNKKVAHNRLSGSNLLTRWHHYSKNVDAAGADDEDVNDVQWSSRLAPKPANTTTNRPEDLVPVPCWILKIAYLDCLAGAACLIKASRPSEERCVRKGSQKDPCGPRNLVNVVPLDVGF